MIEPLSDAVVVACKKAVQTPPYVAVVKTFMSISPTVSCICAVADQPLCVCMELWDYCPSLHWGTFPVSIVDNCFHMPVYFLWLFLPAALGRCCICVLYMLLRASQSSLSFVASSMCFIVCILCFMSPNVCFQSLGLGSCFAHHDLCDVLAQLSFSSSFFSSHGVWQQVQQECLLSALVIRQLFYSPWFVWCSGTVVFFIFSSGHGVWQLAQQVVPASVLDVMHDGICAQLLHHPVHCLQLRPDHHHCGRSQGWSVCLCVCQCVCVYSMHCLQLCPDHHHCGRSQGWSVCLSVSILCPAYNSTLATTIVGIVTVGQSICVSICVHPVCHM